MRNAGTFVCAYPPTTNFKLFKILKAHIQGIIKPLQIIATVFLIPAGGGILNKSVYLWRKFGKKD
jgi:hypothetical protein